MFDDHKNVYDVQFEALYDALDGRGVSAPTDMSVSSASGKMDVTVSAGSVRYEGVKYTNSASATLTISASHDRFNRYDIIVYDTANTTVAVREGAPEGDMPDLNSGDVPLAAVFVKCDTGIIDDGDIENFAPVAALPVDGERNTTATTANMTTDGETAVLADTSGGALTVTLASADAAEGNEVVVKDSGGSAGTNAITVDTEGSETIDGSTSTSVASNYGKVRLVSDGTNWFVA